MKLPLVLAALVTAGCAGVRANIHESDLGDVRPRGGGASWIPAQVATRALLAQAEAPSNFLDRLYLLTNGPICLNGQPCTYKVHFDGTNLVLTAPNNVVHQTGSTISSGTYSGQGNPTLQSSAATKMRLGASASGSILVTDVDGVDIGNGTGDEADGALSTGTLKVGTGGTTIASSIRGTAALDFASAAAGACSAVLTIAVTGATAGTEVSLGVPNASNTTGSQFFAWVSAADTVSVKHCCENGTCDPASGTFAARVFNP